MAGYFGLNSSCIEPSTGRAGLGPHEKVRPPTDIQTGYESTPDSFS
jgi:hypothetical protein